MAKKKSAKAEAKGQSRTVKQPDQPKLPDNQNQQEGDIDPYASGVSLANPEPNNGKQEENEAKPTPQEFKQEFNADASEQDEIAEGREEQIVEDK